MNYTSGQCGKYKPGTYPQPFPRSLTSCKKKFPLTLLRKTTGTKITPNSFLCQGKQEKYEQTMNSCFLFFFNCTSTHPGSYSNKFWLCLLIMGCQDKNVRLCQKSLLLVDKFVDIPPLQTASSLMSLWHITVRERPWNIYENAFKSCTGNLHSDAH